MGNLDALYPQLDAKTQVARTILQQLGGGQFAAMVGLKSAVAHPQGVQIRIGAGAKDSINVVRIMLTPDDVYTMEFFSVRGVTCELVASYDEVYNDMLQDIFESRTGFYCTLMPRRA